MRNAKICMLAVLAILSISCILPMASDADSGSLTGRAFNDDVSVTYISDPASVAFIELAKKPVTDIGVAVYNTKEAQSVHPLPAERSFAIDLNPLSEGIYTFLITEESTGTTIAEIDVPIGYTEFMILYLDPNGAEGYMNPIFAGKGESLKLPSCAFDAPSGKEFKAWSFDGKEYSAGDSIVMDSDKTAKALWKESSGIGVFIIVIAAIVLIAIALLIIFLMRRKHY